MYAVIDLETTGTRTSWHDRIVEVAVVHLDERGRVTGEWCSLVNPERDLGPQLIHGITAAEARRAPTFEQIAGHVAGLVRGRVLAAHNLHFDASFLRAEYRRTGIQAPIDPAAGLCTMRLASHFLPLAGRSLYDCCRAAGLPPHRAHSALHDARAAAQLLVRYLASAGTPPPWEPAITTAAKLSWPPIRAVSVVPVQRRTPGYRDQHFLARLVDRLPRLHEPKGDAYLDLLDQALLDRHVSTTEADALVATAEDLGLARVDVEDLHRSYLAGLAEVAAEDGVVTAAERHDLIQVADLLGLPRPEVDNALQIAMTDSSRQRRHRRDQWNLKANDLVVFTGEMRPQRSEWEEEATAAGLRVGDRVTKKTRLLVAADPDSMSGKAEKARQYGIPIVHPTAYKQMLAGLEAPGAGTLPDGRSMAGTR
ncbi:exonuclease domain-containing protein [Verrucosispora sp. WMMD573]|uniref:exonuclease domain-containing protein n=1 Tax=Verrucosispora sp. WMMD573 TaxID=3015149 RepID=UPI00248AFAAD|nr:exonuclease domain-containing protein [Verrucosispora sp. WMMD573]WBB52466.1 exonuclease domain-containing protein [Verrucosispora sp. WMMD573]